MKQFYLWCVVEGPGDLLSHETYQSAPDLATAWRNFMVSVTDNGLLQYPILFRGGSVVERAPSVEDQIVMLMNQWKRDMLHVSSYSMMVEHPAYEKIVAFGRAALSPLLRDLRDSGEHWHHALSKITGEDPVPPSSRGNMGEVSRAWLKWAEANGISTHRGGTPVEAMWVLEEDLFPPLPKRSK